MPVTLSNARGMNNCASPKCHLHHLMLCFWFVLSASWSAWNIVSFTTPLRVIVMRIREHKGDLIAFISVVRQCLYLAHQSIISLQWRVAYVMVFIFRCDISWKIISSGAGSNGNDTGIIWLFWYDWLSWLSINISKCQISLLMRYLSYDECS